MRAKSSKQRFLALCINDLSCLRLQGWWLIWPPNCQCKSFWLPRRRSRRTSSSFSTNCFTKKQRYSLIFMPCESWYVGCTTESLQSKVKQLVFCSSVWTWLIDASLSFNHKTATVVGAILGWIYGSAPTYQLSVNHFPSFPADVWFLFT